MAPKPDLALAFGLALAVALVVLAITTWADHLPNPAIRLRRSHRGRQFTGLKIGIRTEGASPVTGACLRPRPPTWQADRRRNREVGQGDPGRQHQGGVIREWGKIFHKLRFANRTTGGSEAMNHSVARRC